MQKVERTVPLPVPPSFPTNNFSVDREQKLRVMNWGLGAEREGAEEPCPFLAGSKPELTREHSRWVSLGHYLCMTQSNHQIDTIVHLWRKKGATCPGPQEQVNITNTEWNANKQWEINAHFCPHSSSLFLRLSHLPYWPLSRMKWYQVPSYPVMFSTRVSQLMA